jgi:hypothetical protein
VLHLFFWKNLPFRRADVTTRPKRVSLIGS